MTYVVSAFGVLIALIGGVGVAVPSAFIHVIGGWQGRSRFAAAVGLRVAMAVVCLLAAPACRFPTVVGVVGGVALIAALILLLMGRTRMDALVAYWLDSPPLLIRFSALFASAFGVLLVVSGA